MNYLTLIIYTLFTTLCSGQRYAHKLVKREHSAFELARLEIELQRMQEGESRSAKSNKFQFSSDSFKDDALDDEKCHQNCNERLKSSLDMVKVHQGFGSIGVPPVVDATDLMLFCRYDSEHDKCLRECGFTVQFNMRDFVCKQHYAEMESLLSCYTKAAPTLQRQCGAQRCGPYDGLTQTDKSLIGYAHRCRVLACDIACTREVLLESCNSRLDAERALKYLLNYTREQVTFWLKQLQMREGQAQRKRSLDSGGQGSLTDDNNNQNNNNNNNSNNNIMPYSCKRLFCDSLDLRNCTTNTQ